MPVLDLYNVLSAIIIIGTIVWTIMPYKYKERPKYYWNKYIRYIRQKNVTTHLIIKSTNLKRMKLEDFRKMLNVKLKTEYKEVKETANAFLFDIKIGSKTIETRIDISTDAEDVDTEYVEQLQFTFKIDCKTSNLKSNLINYLNALIELKCYLNDVIKLDKRFLLSCELQSLYKINAILDLGDLELIAGKNTNTTFEMQKNKILIYDKNFNDKFVNIVDDIMINYA